MARESIETEGLICIRHTTGLTDQGRARDAAGLPTSALDEGPIEERFELAGQTETRQSVIGSMRAKAAKLRQRCCAHGTVIAAAEELEHWADRVEQIEETVGELLARTGLEEGDELRLRWPTWKEEIEPAVKRLAEIVHADTGGKAANR